MTDKSKVTVYLTPETKDLIQSCYKEDNCSSVSMFMEKAALFYCGFPRAKQAEHYMPRVLSAFLQGTLDVFADRMGKLMFKQAVESNILHHLFASNSDLDLNTMRGSATAASGRCGRPTGRYPSRIISSSRRICKPWSSSFIKADISAAEAGPAGT